MRKRVAALTGTAAGLGAAVLAQRSFVRRRRRRDPEAGESFGSRRGLRSRTLARPDGASLFVEEVGPESDKAAVFVHGSALRSDVWHYQKLGIGEHRLIFFDLRGHGRSQPKGDAPFTIATLAQDLYSVLESSAVREAVIVGHSIGGMIALELCGSRPELLGDTVKGVVLATTTYRPAFETLAGGAAIARLERMARRPLDFLGSHSSRIDRLRKIVPPSDTLFVAVSLAGFGPRASAKQVDFTYDMLSETPTDVIFDLLKSYRDFDVTESLSRVTVPALVIAGTDDRITVASASEYIARHLPKAELRLLEGCGHMPMLERHDEFNAIVERFLNDVLGAGRELPTAQARR